MPISYAPGIIEVKQLNQLLWTTDTDWNKGLLGLDIEVVGSAVSAKIAPKTTLIPGPDIYLTWHLNETSGTTAADSSQFNRPGTLVTTEGYNPAQWVTGKLNNGLSNPGEYESMDYVEGGDIAGFEYNQPFSVECWFNQSPGYDTRVAGNVTDKGWQIYIQEGYLRFILNGGEGNSLQVYSTTQVTPNAWQHLVVTYNGTGLATGVKFYLDGVLLENSVYYDGLNSASIIPTVNNFHLGAANEGGWIGQIDEFNLYTVVLSQANVDFRYNAGAGTETPGFTQPFYPTTAHYETNIVDSKIAGQLWNSVNFLRTIPSGTTIEIKMRASDDANTMGSYGSALTPGANVELMGQFIQFSVDFTGTTSERAEVESIGVLYTASPVHSVVP